MSTKWYIVILISLGLLTHFIFFGHPNETVFDEVHFGKFISGYYTGEYLFDIHPPLGKLVIAGFAKLFNFKPGFAFAEIGNKFPDKQYMILRFLPNLAGSLLPLVIYLLLVAMGINRLASFFGGLFIVFENALLTQSHYILLDSFLLLFGFLALFFYFKFKKSILHTTPHQTIPLSTIKKRGGFGTGQAYYLLLFGLFGGLALSVKWTGLSFLALPLIFEFVSIIRNKQFKSLFTVLLPPLVTAVLIYFIFFTAHLIILNKSGPGDAFMSRGFQKTLVGNQNEKDEKIVPSNFFQKFFELNVEMYKANQRLTATHPYSSQWYSWPFMTRPIYYWVNGNARIYLLGNPVIWWASTVAVSYLVFSILYLVFRKYTTSYKLQATSYFLLAGYIINMLPFISVKRVMFLYHYFTAYIFAIMILVWLISQNKNSEKIFRVLLAFAVIAFVYFAPLSYGLKLSTKAYEARVWLDSWK